jgi:hypothetical protein
MLIKMRTTMAGPDGVVLAGQTADVPEKKAVALVGAGFAEYAGPVDGLPKAAEPVREVAAVTPKREKATKK